MTFVNWPWILASSGVLSPGAEIAGSGPDVGDCSVGYESASAGTERASGLSPPYEGNQGLRKLSPAK